MVKDLTKGDPLKLILGFYFPIMASMLLQQAYNVADTVVVGRMVDAKALAAVGATGSVTVLFLGFVEGCTAGSAIPVARYFGAGQYDKMRRAVAGALIFTLLICAVITALGLPLITQILRLMHCPADIFAYSRTYLFYIFLGTVFLGLSNLTSGLLRAVGNSRTPLFSLAVAGIANVGFNILFVSLGMKVAGVALGTVIAQFLSALICGVYIFRKVPELIPRKEDVARARKATGRAAALGAPMGFQFSITAIGSLVLQTATNTLGTVVVSAVTAAGKIFLIFACGIMEPLGTGMVTYVSQNLGAGRIDRVRRGMRLSLIIIQGIAAVSAVISVFGGKRLMGLFLSGSEPARDAILSNGATYLTIFAAFYPALALVFLYRNAVQGLGYGKTAMIGGILELIGRCGVTFALIAPLGIVGVSLASPVAWFFAGVFFLAVYLIIIRRLQRHQERK